MTIRHNLRLRQKSVLAENRRSIQGLLDTLGDDRAYVVMGTGETLSRPGRCGNLLSYAVQRPARCHIRPRPSISAEDGVVEESAMKGAHRGPLLGVEAAGREIELPITIVFPMRDCKNLGERLYFEVATAARQMGAA